MGAAVTHRQAPQLLLFEQNSSQRMHRLDALTDSIRQRFGDDAIKRARVLPLDSNHDDSSAVHRG
jgi:hypothetical protein